jgi:PAS domain-containing protein
MTGSVGRWERSARPRVLIAAVVLVTVAIVGMVGLNAVLLGRMTQQVEAAQSRSASLSNATRETLLLLQVVTDLPETADAQHLDVQRGVMGRHVAVAAPSFPPDDPKARELLDVRTEVARFPWDRLVATGGREAALRLSAMSLISRSERRINALRSQEAKQFYAATVASLAAKQRGQFALAALMTVVLGLGAGGIAVVMRRSRSDVEKAYSALKGEVNERRVAEEALRASEGRFRSLVQRASDLTIVTDDGGVVTYVSPAVEALVGYPPDDFLDLPLLVHVEPQERGAVATSITGSPSSPASC